MYFKNYKNNYDDEMNSEVYICMAIEYPHIYKYYTKKGKRVTLLISVVI